MGGQQYFNPAALFITFREVRASFVCVCNIPQADRGASGGTDIRADAWMHTLLCRLLVVPVPRWAEHLTWANNLHRAVCRARLPQTIEAVIILTVLFGFLDKANQSHLKPSGARCEKTLTPIAGERPRRQVFWRVHAFCRAIPHPFPGSGAGPRHVIFSPW